MQELQEIYEQLYEGRKRFVENQQDYPWGEFIQYDEWGRGGDFAEFFVSTRISNGKCQSFFSVERSLGIQGLKACVAMLENFDSMCDEPGHIYELFLAVKERSGLELPGWKQDLQEALNKYKQSPDEKISIDEFIEHFEPDVGATVIATTENYEPIPVEDF